MRWLLTSCVCAALLSSGLRELHANDHQQELNRLRKSIEETKQRIKDLGRRESKAMRSLSSTQRQQKNLQKIISGLSTRLTMFEDSLLHVNQQIVAARATITNTVDRWKLLTWGMHEYAVLHRGQRSRSALAPYLYLSLTRSTLSRANQLSNMADSLALRMDYLGNLSAVQSASLREQELRSKSLKKTEAEQTKEIRSVRASKQQLLEELKKKEQSATKIRSLIQQLVARESKKKQGQQSAKKSTGKGTSISKGSSTVATNAPQRGAFKAKSLSWPTSGRSILHGYGTYTNASTGTTHENPGIDIKANAGSSVSCVAQGQVSTVTWLPGFGSLVIVDHNNGFRTVYANLASVAVQRGSHVGQGSRIGTSGSNLDGDLVHFEVWIEGKRINPLTYLR